MDKSRASQRTETEYKLKTMNKSRSISSASLSNKSTNIEQLKEINVRSDSPSISSMSRPGASVTTASPEKQRITCKYKRNKTSENLIKVKESIQEPENPSKRAKEDSITDGKNIINKKTPQFEDKEDYIDSTNDKTL